MKTTHFHTFLMLCWIVFIYTSFILTIYLFTIYLKKLLFEIEGFFACFKLYFLQTIFILKIKLFFKIKLCAIFLYSIIYYIVLCILIVYSRTTHFQYLFTIIIITHNQDYASVCNHLPPSLLTPFLAPTLHVLIFFHETSSLLG